MKKLIVLVAMFATATAYAGNDSLKIMRAKAAFGEMTEVQALSSKKAKQLFNAQELNRRLPGTNIWTKASKLCVDGDVVRMAKPMIVCKQWKVALKDGVNRYKYFDNAAVASSFAEDASDAQGSAVCAKKEPLKYSHPIVWKANSCLVYGVKTSPFNKVKTFKYLGQADDFAENDEDAIGDAFCVEKGIVTKSISTEYTVDFYAKVTFPEGNYDGKYDDKLAIGSHTYLMNSCDAGALTPVPAN